LRHYFRSQLGVLAGVTLAAAVLIGALAVGDSVKGSLKARALERLPGETAFALATGERFYSQALVTNLVPDPYVQLQRWAWTAASGDGKLMALGKLGNTRIANALILPGALTRQDGSARANRISVIGLNPGELLVDGTNSLPASRDFSGDRVWLNESLAAQLAAKAGDQVVLRLHKPSALSQDAVLSPRDEMSVALRLTVGGIVPATAGGNLSLLANQTSPLNAFLSLEALSASAGLTGRANLLLADSPRIILDEKSWRSRLVNWLAQKGVKVPPGWLSSTLHSTPATPVANAFLAKLLGAQWTLADAELELRAREGATHTGPVTELTTRRIFLEPAVVRAALTNQSEIGNRKSEIPAPTPLLTYLVNGLAHGDKLAPYSMVTAAGAPYTPADLKDDEIVVNQWLADDLGVKPGDSLALTYYRVDAGTQLQEHTNTFRVHSIVPLAGLHADRTLMPEFPGLSKAESTHDWDAGFDLVHPIRDQDEAYWKQHRGTPKAFITPAAGQKLWANRFGELTAIRWFVDGPPSPRPSPPGRGGSAPGTDNSTAQTPLAVGAASANAALSSATSPVESAAAQPATPSPGGEGRGEGGQPSNLSVTELRDALTARIRANLNPADVGLVWRPVREEALRAAESGTGKDFGGLMIGFSFFLITSALLLTAMLFRFALEQRTGEVGILLALGWPPARVRGLLFREGLALAVLGSVLGAVLGCYYAKGVLWGLTTIWRDAIAGAGLEFHLTPVTLLTGLALSITVAAVTMLLALRQQVRRPARELLNEGANEAALSVAEGGSRKPKLAALGASVLALGLVAAAWTMRETKPELFFGAGALLLIAGLLWVRVWIRSVGSAGSVPTVGDTARAGSQPALRSLAFRALARRPSRSLGTVALLASAAFLIVAIAAMKLDATRNADRRESGTGGFALWGESSLPVIQDLNTAKGQEFYGLNPGDLKGVSFVQLRVRDGDDASCLNLNGAQRPRLLGVKPEQLAERGAFTFTKVLKGLEVTNGWLALNSQFPIPNSQARETPAIGDAASIQWALKSSVGGTLDFTDERGQPFKVRIVGAVANSVLQGNLIIAEADFVRLFPSESGYRGFLMDTPGTASEAVSATLSRALQDVGLELTPTTRRLAQFNAVQNTYLNTFQILGGLGLLLGSVGLGVVVLRNVQERRGELGLMLALGFAPVALRRLVLTEHVALLLLGLGVGLVAALVAVLPSLGTPGSDFPWRSLSVTLGLVLANGLVWTVWATARSLRGRLVDSLRHL
jgi:ABC-type antimicrobial peptide transport system permease subunit